MPQPADALPVYQPIEHPQKEIVDLLQRRSDLSTFLVHLTRDGYGSDAREKLLAILTEGTLRARNPMGLLARRPHTPQEVKDTQRVVCFTETPLEHVWMLTENIKDRAVDLKPYGLAVTKTWARRSGVNPIWYIDITPGHDWLTRPLNDLVERVAIGHSQRWNEATKQWVPDTLNDYPLLKLTPFIEQMGKPRNVRKEFWWEREWRHAGDLTFTWSSVMCLFVPADDHAAFRQELAERFAELGYAAWDFKLLDPRWGLERMIATLAGVAGQELGPFPA